MDRRRYLTLAGTAATGALAGCVGEVTDVVEGTTKEASQEANESVDEAMDTLTRPPSADVRVERDGTVIVRSLGGDTVGVMCGFPETESPVEELETSERAVTGPGALENCTKERLVAVNEAGDIKVIERLE
ncbi:hypothetical protein [Halopiger xanaduensis]|uniref:Uncharacterized protein n=1 Tax=Halopiger xanaduensis (strain DSM 18323 / JCM 14033 / SH-6) TaxID=797210 RepID=F8D5V7_HALXS|nr:hypothetical protein [Halopiger xanaduensis]AEH37683.1 hypothetical protein Halxa_3069 [Halopiger xanaduensis SH-6]